MGQLVTKPVDRPTRPPLIGAHDPSPVQRVPTRNRGRERPCSRPASGAVTVRGFIEEHDRYVVPGDVAHDAAGPRGSGPGARCLAPAVGGVRPTGGSGAHPAASPVAVAYVADKTRDTEGPGPMTFILWLILAALSWPLALLAAIAYPIVWLLLLPFRLLKISVDGVLDTLRAVVELPGRLLALGHR